MRIINHSGEIRLKFENDALQINIKDLATAAFSSKNYYYKEIQNDLGVSEEFWELDAVLRVAKERKAAKTKEDETDKAFAESGGFEGLRQKAREAFKDVSMIPALKDELKELQERAAAKSEQITHSQERVKELEDQLRQTRANIHELNSTKKSEGEKAKAELEELKKQLGELKTAKEEENNRVERLAAEAQNAKEELESQTKELRLLKSKLANDEGKGYIERLLTSKSTIIKAQLFVAIAAGFYTTVAVMDAIHFPSLDFMGADASSFIEGIAAVLLGFIIEISVVAFSIRGKTRNVFIAAIFQVILIGHETGIFEFFHAPFSHSLDQWLTALAVTFVVPSLQYLLSEIHSD